MSNWQEEYKSKLTSNEEAVKLISKNQLVCIGMAIASPEAVVHALSKRLPELGYLNMLSMNVGYPFEFLSNPEYKKYFKLYSYFLGPLERTCENSDNIEVVPFHLGQFDYLIRNHYKIDVLITEVTPPDDEGNMSFSVGGAMQDVMVRVASKVIVSVNNRAPYIATSPANLIHVSKVDAIVENNHEIFETPEIPITDVEKKIAHLIADRIEDGSTIQIGMGGLANAIGYFLDDKKDLGIHTEMISDSIMELAKKGVITGNKKTLHPGQIVCSLPLGTRSLYDWIDHNPTIAFHPISYVNDPNVIAKNDNLVSVMNALIVDLSGQVGSESIGFNQYSNTGGQVEFVRGAFLAKNGKSYIALNSTTETKKGLISRIVSSFPPGQVVTTPRTDVDSLVTEYGIAELRGKSIPDRVKAMINIAHPQFRDELTSEAKKAGILY